MSLDIYVTVEKPIIKQIGTGIFVRRNGATTELSREEVREMYPDHELAEEGLYETCEVCDLNITHNLTTMAEKAGLYEIMWHPTTSDAKDFIVPLATGLKELLELPDYYRSFNPENGWGNYEQLRDTVAELLKVCITYPEAKVTCHG
jgi:hypothetical protein